MVDNFTNCNNYLYSYPDFPIGILQKSFKLVTEPPDGLNLNMARVFSSVTEESLENDSSHEGYKSLVFVISFFHSVLQVKIKFYNQDRKKYGKIGWNVAYDFNESDFLVSKRLLSMYLNKNTRKEDQIPWISLKYLIGECMYGGRVTDEWDRRLMMTYLNEYMGDFIFDTNQKFYFSKTGFDFLIPPNGNYDSYTKYISSIPLTYSPEVIGLHSNAEIDYFTQTSLLLWTNMLVLQKSSVDSGDKSIDKDSYIKGLANSIKQKLPPKFDLPAIGRKYPNKSPTQVIFFLF